MRRVWAMVLFGLLLAVPMAGCGNDPGDDPDGGSDGGTDGGEPGLFDGLDAAEAPTIAGLEGQVEVLRDPYGVPHVFCEVQLDCFRAQGYLQAHDRLFEMDFYRRLAKGELDSSLAPMVAGLARETDRFHRRMFTARDGRPVIEHIEETLSDDTRAVLQAFADGVNAYYADLGQPWAPISPEYEFFGVDTVTAENPPPAWTIGDSLAVARYFTWSLSGTFEDELEAGAMVQALGPETFAQLFPARPVDDTFIVPGSPAPLAQALSASPAAAPAHLAGVDFRALDRQLDPVRPYLGHLGDMPGSNNWIVDGAHSATGNTLVANDPHLSLLSPSVWWEVHLDAVSLPGAQGDLQVAGTIFPGTPGVIIGHNQHLAWGETVAGYDVTDLYVETPGSTEDTVMFNGAEVPVLKVTVDFPRGPTGVDQEKICVVPHHGPIVLAPTADGFTAADFADPAQPCVPAGATNVVSVRWTGHDPTHEAEFLWKLDLAADLTEAKDALQSFGVGAQNWVIGDTQGNLLYYPRANVPVRSWTLGEAPPFVPLDGRGAFEWGEGWVPDAQLPQAENPAQGYIATANQDLIGTTADNDVLNDPLYLYYTRDLGLRGGRIARLLEGAMTGDPVDGADYLVGDGVVSLDEMKAIQSDTYLELGARLTPHLLAVADAPENAALAGPLADALQLLRDWSFQTPTGLDGSDPVDPAVTAPQVLNDAAATTLFHAWFWKALDATFLDELQAAGAASPAATAAPHNQPMQKAFIFLVEGDAAYPDSLFDDVATTDLTETRADVLLGALAEAAAELSADPRLGTDPAAWLWGRVHVVPFPSPIGLIAGDLLDEDPYALGPVANDGGLHTIDVANSGPSFTQGSGASMRHVTDVSPDGVSSDRVITGGVIDLADHPNRGDQTDLWLKGEYKAPIFTLEAAIEAAKARNAAGTAAPAGRWSLLP